MYGSFMYISLKVVRHREREREIGGHREREGAER